MRHDDLQQHDAVERVHHARLRFAPSGFLTTFPQPMPDPSNGPRPSPGA